MVLKRISTIEISPSFLHSWSSPKTLPFCLVEWLRRGQKTLTCYWSGPVATNSGIALAWFSEQYNESCIFLTYFEISKAKEVIFFALKKKGPRFVALGAKLAILGGGR